MSPSRLTKWSYSFTLTTNKPVGIEAGLNTRRGVVYDFQVNLSLEDLGELIAYLAKDGIKHAPSDVRNALKPHLGSLLKLISSAKGFTLQRIRKPKSAADHPPVADDAGE